MVWSPDFLEGFDLELDFWMFEHNERIVQLNPQVILDARNDKGVTRAMLNTEGNIVAMLIGWRRVRPGTTSALTAGD